MPAVLVVDWGATSIRVARVEFTPADGGARAIGVTIVHRHHHRPITDDRGALRWDWHRLMAETMRGLEVALELGPVASIGVDTWGVDYGLLDDRGLLVAPPFSYRDRRTDDWRATLEQLGGAAAYSITGVQSLPFNTAFQLAAHRDDELRAATTLLMLPDLVVHDLCGHVGTERTAAGTTGLLDVHTRAWSSTLCAALHLPAGLLPPIVEPGTVAGTWRDVPVHLVGSHDTASAVVGGARAGRVFVASGTWLLVGMERDVADVGPAARDANFSNEQGTFGGIRFLRNVAGGWLLDECSRSWGTTPAELLAAAAAEPADVPTFDATDDALVQPDDMPATVRRLAGLPPSAPRAAIARCIVESIAETVSRLADRLGGGGIDLFGGAGASSLLVDALRRRSGRDVAVGHQEATVIGNALTQAVSLGWCRDVAEARTLARV